MDVYDDDEIPHHGVFRRVGGTAVCSSTSDVTKVEVEGGEPGIRIFPARCLA